MPDLEEQRLFVGGTAMVLGDVRGEDLGRTAACSRRSSTGPSSSRSSGRRSGREVRSSDSASTCHTRRFSEHPWSVRHMGSPTAGSAQ
jgi:hypothetical protein